MRCWFGHKWTKWMPHKTITHHITKAGKLIKIPIDNQYRYCLRCMRKQVRDFDAE